MATTLLTWREILPQAWEAVIGTPGDCVIFCLSFQPTCCRRGKWKLLVEVCSGVNHERWGCFDEQDQPLRYYHSKENARAEADLIAQVLLADRQKYDQVSAKNKPIHVPRAPAKRRPIKRSTRPVYSAEQQAKLDASVAAHTERVEAEIRRQGIDCKETREARKSIPRA